MKDREVIDEPYENTCELVLAESRVNTNKYHIMRVGGGILATVVASEHVAKQILRAINKEPLYYYEENLPQSVSNELEPVNLNFWEESFSRSSK